MSLCECGCGQEVTIFRGKPRRFVAGHNPGKSGPQNPNWSGGRTKTKAGYVYISAPDHPRSNSNGYALEHVLIAERALGRPLPARAQVHHVNGIPDDNRPTNLVVCEDQAYHRMLHNRRAALDAGGEMHWRRCWICREWDDPKNLYENRGSAFFHRKCRRERDKESLRSGGAATREDAESSPSGVGEDSRPGASDKEEE